MKATILVLIVDDDAEIRLVLQNALEEGGFAVLEASNAREAIDILDARGEEVRALVTDVNIGRHGSGWDVARHARKKAPDLPVVYVTGAEGHDWASQGVPNSILIKKPFALTQVLTAVSQLLNMGNTPGA